jgi:hypothetical protein
VPTGSICGQRVARLALCHELTNSLRWWPRLQLLGRRSHADAFRPATRSTRPPKLVGEQSQNHGSAVPADPEAVTYHSANTTPNTVSINTALRYRVGRLRFHLLRTLLLIHQNTQYHICSHASLFPCISCTIRYYMARVLYI